MGVQSGLQLKSRWRLVCLALLTLGFVTSRLTLAKYQTFDLSTWMWQIVDLDLLRSHLTQSVFYLHGQPPLLNLSLGVVLKLTPDQFHAQQVLSYLFRLMGLFLALGTFQLLVDLSVPMVLALVITLLFEFNPGSLMLERWFYTPYPTEFLLLASALFLNRFLVSHGRAYGVAFLVCAALPVFINSSFQPVWFICVLGFSYYCFRSAFRELLPTALALLALIAVLIVKNAIVFGTVTTSSWFGMNLARMTTFELPGSERTDAIRSGEISEFSRIGPFSSLDKYPMLSPAEPTGIEVLDRRKKADGPYDNYNNILYVSISRHYLHDALWSLTHHPGAYCRGMVMALGCYLGASNDQSLADHQRARIDIWNSFYDLLMHPIAISWWPHRRSCGLIALTLLIGVPLLLCFASIKLIRAEVWSASEVTIAFILMAVVYTTAVGVMFEVGENARFRSVIDPFLLIIFGVLMTSFGAQLRLVPVRQTDATIHDGYQFFGGLVKRVGLLRIGGDLAKAPRLLFAIGRSSQISFRPALGLFFLFVVLALMVAAIVNAPFSYDGAYLFFHLMDTRSLLSVARRGINVPLRIPALVVSHFTNNLAILRLVYSACYVAIPAIALAVSWRICKRTRPSRFAWPALSIGLAALPGQFAFHSEANHGVNLLWPPLLFALSDLPSGQIPMVAISTVVAWCAYPPMAIHLALIAVVAFASAWKQPGIRMRALGFGGAMALMALSRVLWPMSSYEKGVFGLHTLKYTFYSAVLGWPLVSASLTLIAAAALLWSSTRRRDAEAATRIATISIILAGVSLIPWAMEPHAWSDTQGYRFWYPGIALALMSGAAIEALTESEVDDRLTGLRSWCLVSIGVVFFLVLSLQSLTWMVMTRRLSNLIAEAREPCISKSQVPWLKGTALQHWSSDYYALDLQSRKPSAVLLENDDCKILAASGQLRLVGWGSFQDAQDGWFNFSSVRSFYKQPHILPNPDKPD